MKRIFAFAFGLVLLSALASAQVQTGTPLFGTFSNGPDVINIGNLNTHLTIPVLNKPGRGQNFVYNVTYDSSVWYPTISNGSKTWQPVTGWGWHGAAPPLYPAYASSISYSMTTSSGSCGGGPYPISSWRSWSYGQVVYVDQNGTAHTFPNASGTYMVSPGSAQGCPNAGASPPMQVGPVMANDSSGLGLYYAVLPGYINAHIVTPKGTTITPPINANSGLNPNWSYSSIDTNGNEITGQNGTYVDTTGNVALTVTANTQQNTTALAFKNTTGSNSQYVFNYAPYNIQTNFKCPGISEYAASGVNMISSVTLPDMSTYQFQYEQTPGNQNTYTGRVASVTLPTGGVISYQYTGGSNGITCADGSTSGLTRTLNSDSGSAAQTWTYARSAPNGAGTTHTEVVDGLGNQLNYDFVPPSNPSLGITAAYYETHRNVYEGAESGTPLLARSTCYNQASTPPQSAPASCTAGQVSTPFSQVDTYETLDGIQTHGTTAAFNAGGMQTLAEVWDFATGAASRGPILWIENWDYAGSALTSDSVYDNSAPPNLVRFTTYQYDGTLATPSSGVPQHGAMYSRPGNLTQVTQQVSSDPNNVYTTTLTYEDTGSPLTVTTPNGTTTLTYDSTFVYNTGASLPTPSSGVALSGGASFDTTYTGLPLTATDPNTRVTQITTYDAMLRPTQLTSPDGGASTWLYTPNTITTTTSQSPNPTATSLLQLDGYGRTSGSQVTNANGHYQRDTCYDGNGNISFSSYPYAVLSNTFAFNACAGNGDRFTYDALGRLTRMTRQDNEVRSYTYLGRATQSVDEIGVTRISQVDGLGRPSIVCEAASGTNLLPLGTSAANCGTDIAGTGFTTNYSYTLATGTTTITQGSQTRTFVSDWLGRPTSVTEPESGTTTYTYAYNGTGLQVVRTRPRANQQGSLTTATATQYDSMGRVVSVTYTDGTPTKTFAYDTSAGVSTGNGADFTDLTQANLKGRLSMAAVPGMATAFSYDPMGRTAALDECLPNGCGNAGLNKQLLYSYDQAGNMLTSTDGGGVTSTYGISPAGELLSLTSSLNVPSTNPPNIISNVQNGPFGPSTYSFGNGLNNVNTYDTLGRLQGGFVCGNSSSVSCAGGTQLYGFAATWKGNYLVGSSDTALNFTAQYGYDGFGRLIEQAIGGNANYTYAYDRYGNRWQQNGGWSSQLNFNQANNQAAGYTYDAAGNMTYDGFHNYTYDAEGNLITVDGGAETYNYNALNQRVGAYVNSLQTGYASAPGFFVFNANGQRVSEWKWNGTTYVQLKGKYFWGTKQVGYYTTSASPQTATTFFEHQDWQGTERLHTLPNGTTPGYYTSLPWGDGLSSVGSDPDHFATLDHDSETGTEHAQFRQYSSAQGHWMSPDPYGGSYDISNPQSFNRYVYALNNPLSHIDPSGLDNCDYGPSDNGGEDTDEEADCGQDGSNGVLMPENGTGTVLNMTNVIIHMNGVGSNLPPNFDPGGDTSGFGIFQELITQNFQTTPVSFCATGTCVLPKIQQPVVPPFPLPTLTKEGVCAAAAGVTLVVAWEAIPVAGTVVTAEDVLLGKLAFGGALIAAGPCL